VFSEVHIMSDVREALEMMREVAKIRIDMLQNRVTFHDEQKRNYYLREYRDKLQKIDAIMRRMNIRLVRVSEKEEDKELDD
jgi:hypothetical protein